MSLLLCCSFICAVLGFGAGVTQVTPVAGANETCLGNPLLQTTASMNGKLKIRSSSPGSVGLLILADKTYRANFHSHLRSIRCYAERQKYDLHVFALHREQPARCADFKVPYFKKHCIVAEFLRAKPAGYTVVVLDIDVAAVISDRGLDKWLDHAADLQFYIRDTGNSHWPKEIVSGGYVASNSAFTRNFLMRWARYEARAPPGFSSCDNGAIHVMLLHATRVEGGNKCGKMYERLTALVTDLGPYWQFVSCAFDALGSPRSWYASSEDGTGVVIVWPRYQGWMTDWFRSPTDNSGTASTWSADLGPIFQHGIKGEEHLRQSHLYSNLSTCQMNASSQASRSQLASLAVIDDDSCPQCTSDCMKNFACEPLGPFDGDVQVRQLHVDVPFTEPAVTGDDHLILRTTLAQFPTPWNWEADDLELAEPNSAWQSSIR